MQLLNTLYVTTPESYLRLDNDTLRIEVDREVKLRVPLHHLNAVVCFGHINLSAPLMHRLADDRALSGRDHARASAAARELLQDWCLAGWLHGD